MPCLPWAFTTMRSVAPNYAAFHHARALLLLEGLEPKSHRGVFALLENHFEATGRLSSGALSRFARLQTFRGLADYDAQGRLPAERATEEVASARRFVEEAQKVLASGSKTALDTDAR